MNATAYFTYVLTNYIDQRPDTPLNGMIYDNTQLVNCSLSSLNILQLASTPVQYTVIPLFLPIQTNRRRELCVTQLRPKDFSSHLLKLRLKA